MISKLRVLLFVFAIVSAFFLWSFIPGLLDKQELLVLNTFRLQVQNHDSKDQNVVIVKKEKSFHAHNEKEVVKNIKVDISSNSAEEEEKNRVKDLEDQLRDNIKDNKNDNDIKTVKKEIEKDKEKDKTIEVDMKEKKDGEQEKVKEVIKKQENTEGPPLCPEKGENLVGPLFIDQSLVKDLAPLEQELGIASGGNVEKGGWYQPTMCTPLTKVAIIIPYRNRFEQLKIFLRHMHPFLQRQRFYYRIFVVEQLFDDPFNRAGLFNIGYTEAIKMAEFDCFVFTDVDLVPEDDRNYYGCPTSPRHMSVAVDKFNYKLPYEAIFGGCGSFKRQHYEDINGMSNLFWGWGGEDDDLFARIKKRGYKLTRPAMQIGRYTMVRIHHFQSSQADPNRMNLLQSSNERMEFDGLNTLKYNLKEIVVDPLVTFFKIEMKKSMYNL